MNQQIPPAPFRGTTKKITKQIMDETPNKLPPVSKDSIIAELRKGLEKAEAAFGLEVQCHLSAVKRLGAAEQILQIAALSNRCFHHNEVHDQAKRFLEGEEVTVVQNLQTEVASQREVIAKLREALTEIKDHFAIGTGFHTRINAALALQPDTSALKPEPALGKKEADVNADPARPTEVPEPGDIVP